MEKFFGPMEQIGIVVDDFNDPINHWTKNLNVGPFIILEHLDLNDVKLNVKRNMSFEDIHNRAMEAAMEAQTNLLYNLTERGYFAQAYRSSFAFFDAKLPRFDFFVADFFLVSVFKAILEQCICISKNNCIIFSLTFSKSDCSLLKVLMKFSIFVSISDFTS